MINRILTLLIFVCGALSSSWAQQVGVKTNALGWATTTPNLSVDYALGKKTTLEIHGRYNPFRFSEIEENKKLQHWIVMPEIRFWVFEKFDGHYFGIHPFYGRYNAGGVKLPLKIFEEMKDHRFEGYGTGLGVSYGYQWTLASHWNLEATFGFGYSYMNYNKYECHKCGDLIGKEIKHYFGPTRIGVSIIYLFKSQK